MRFQSLIAVLISYRLLFQLSTAQDVITSYGVIIDCGSTGSRAHIFKYPKIATNSSTQTAYDLAPNLSELVNPSSPGKTLVKRIQPGLATVIIDASDPVEAAAIYLKPLLNFAQEHVPADRAVETPVYILATAGLRLLEGEGIDLQVLPLVAKRLQGQYRFRSIGGRVITGSEEGFFEWLTVNAFSQTLSSEFQQIDNCLYCKSPIGRRFGMIEMGGASTQVTYDLGGELEKIIELELKHSPGALRAFRSQVFDVDHITEDPRQKVKLFSTSFLGLGSDQARLLNVDLQVRFYAASNKIGSISSPLSLTISDPCLPIGANQTLHRPREILEPNSVLIGLSELEASRLTATEPIEIKLIGSGHFQACWNSLYNLLVWVKKEKYNCNKARKSSNLGCETDLIGLNFVPFKFFQFIGISEFYYVSKMLNITGNSFQLAKLYERTWQFCSKRLDVLISENAQDYREDANRVILGCFRASWVSIWLQFGIRMPPKHVIPLKPLDQLNSKQLDYTFGAMLARLVGQVEFD